MNKPMRKDTLETRRQLLAAAERLFGERGIDNVSLVDITREAGQKNRNALQYHFGDKVGLINAVLDKHTDRIAEERQRMLDELVESGEPDLRSLIDVLVLPVANHVALAPNSLAFLLINAQMMTSVDYAKIADDRAHTVPEVRRLEKMIAGALPPMERRELRARFLLVQSMMFHGLASFYTLNPGANSAAFNSTLCASAEAILSQAPA